MRSSSGGCLYERSSVVLVPFLLLSFPLLTFEKLFTSYFRRPTITCLLASPSGTKGEKERVQRKRRKKSNKKSNDKPP